MDKNKAFGDLIFKTYGNDRNYDHLRHNILNIRESMMKRHSCFCKKSIKKQFEYCETIGVIAVHTQLQHMNENKPLSLPEERTYKYSIDRDWKEPKIIGIKSPNPLELVK